MPTALTQFQIEGLHGRNRTIDVPIRDNRLVLVGENGTCKSTVANLLYDPLTQQWRRIMDYQFAAIQVRSADAQVRILEGVQKVAREAGRSIKTTIQLHPHTFIQLLVAGIPTPASLDAFLSFHMKRGAAQSTADSSNKTAGMRHKIVKFIKGA